MTSEERDRALAQIDADAAEELDWATERARRKIAKAIAGDIAVHVDQTRDDTLLGASEAAAVLGLDKFKSPMSVWLAKRAARAGEPPPPENKPAFVAEAAEWGQALEPVIRGKYALATSCHVLVPTKSVTDTRNVHGFFPFLRCTPDGIVCPNSDGPSRACEADDYTGYPVYRRARDRGTAGLLQVKTCSAYKADEWADGVPPAYEVQVRVEMAVCDLPWCDVVCLIGGQKYAGPFRVHRDLKIEANILRDLRKFWELVLDGTPPDVDGSDAWSEYASSRMTYTKVSIPADDDCRAYLAELRMARTERKRALRQEAELKNKILLRLGAAGATVLDGGDLGKCTAYPNAARMAWKEYAEELEAAIRRMRDVQVVPNPQESAFDALRERFKKPGSGWALRTPKSWSADDGDEE